MILLSGYKRRVLRWAVGVVIVAVVVTAVLVIAMIGTIFRWSRRIYRCLRRNRRSRNSFTQSVFYKRIKHTRMLNSLNT